MVLRGNRFGHGRRSMALKPDKNLQGGWRPERRTMMMAMVTVIVQSSPLTREGATNGAPLPHTAMVPSSP